MAKGIACLTLQRGAHELCELNELCDELNISCITFQYPGLHTAHSVHQQEGKVLRRHTVRVSFVLLLMKMDNDVARKKSFITFINTV